MWSMIALVEAMNTLGFPLLAIVAMFASKLTAGPTARIVDRCFIVMLTLQCLLTIRTVISMDMSWLVHMMTLMMLIVGTVVIPSIRDTPSESSL